MLWRILGLKVEIICNNRQAMNKFLTILFIFLHPFVQDKLHGKTLINEKADEYSTK